MNFIQEKFKKYNDQIIKNINYIDQVIAQIKESLEFNENEFINLSCANIKIHELTDSVSEIISKYETKIAINPSTIKLKSKIHELNILSNNYLNLVRNHNEQTANLFIDEGYNLIKNVENHKLDHQQMLCIVKPAYNHLVIAGAGTGKTTTIIGKIKYLLSKELVNHNQILVLSFTNASAYEMRERINNETNQTIDALTFHALGLNIISTTTKKKPNITSINLPKFVREQIELLINNEVYFTLLLKFLLYNQILAKSEFEFSSEKEYKEYLINNPPTTMKNEVVKSYGEMDIANFLYENNINYIYESPYKLETADETHSQYHPDFYLPDYDLYIEYFGINRENKVPNYFKGEIGKSASEVYNDSIKWKRNLHKTNDTHMIECYAYEKMEGDLIKNLKKKLNDSNVTLNPKSPKELWADLSNDNPSILVTISELFATIINLTKSNNYTIDYLSSLNKQENNSNTKSINVLINLINPIFNAYNNELIKRNEIDFNDMINLATELVKKGEYINNYKYVIIDEYQDISKSRFNLVKALRNSNDFSLFCVGDDWQSIYRFAGSDIGYILNFEKYWGVAEISKIETTYRFPQKLIEITSNFIMKNPSQIKKSIEGKSINQRFPLGEILCFSEKLISKYIKEKLFDLPKNKNVFLIGRYNFDKDVLQDKDFRIKYNNVTGIFDVTYYARQDLKINFLTAHKSKGLQADYVFIINNKNTKTGFPSKIQDSPIFDLLLEKCDTYPFSEERRLFYVAMTRAKEKVYLVTIKGKYSMFAKELLGDYSEDINREHYECPLCGGQLRVINGKYGKFLGCSNYKSLGCTYHKNIVSNSHKNT